MKAFHPAQHAFVKLRDFRLGGHVGVYEYRNHPAVDGVPNFLRINLYLSKDHDFVCIWHGLLEAMFVEHLLRPAPLPADFDFYHAYNVELFRGYIDSNETAAVILKALRAGGPGYAVPHILSGSPDGLRCDVLGDASR